MISNAIAPSTPSCFFTLLEHTILPAQIVYILSWNFFFQKDLILMGILTISRQFQGKMQRTFAVCFEISKQTTKQLRSLLWNFKANYKAQFEISKQTTKHNLKFQSKLQSTLCNFNSSFVVFTKLQSTFAVCFETANLALQFALKLQSALCSLLWNFKANCKGTLHFALKLSWNCQNSHENHIFFEGKSQEKNRKCWNIIPGFSNSSPLTLNDLPTNSLSTIIH